MIKRLSAVLCGGLLMLCSSVFADTQVTATWDANPEADVAGYRVYDNGVEIASTLAGTETVVFTSSDGTHEFTVTCYDTFNNESIPSDPISRVYDTVDPSQPGGFLFVDEINVP